MPDGAFSCRARAVLGRTFVPTEPGVAPDGRLHGLDSVYVADASLFPTSVKVNPYETVMVLATHVAERVAERHTSE